MEENEIYSVLGEEGFTRLVSSFYRQVTTDNILGPLYPAHDFNGAEERLRMRHAPFPVNQAARDRWMKLMDNALAEVEIPSEAKQILRNYFDSTATAMMNRL